MNRSGTFKRLVVYVALCLSAGHPALAQIIPTSPTTLWTTILYPTNAPTVPDPAGDQQTGSKEGDIVGNGLTPSLYTQFYNGGTPSLTDGQIAFRFRLAEEKNPPGYSGFAFVGLDANNDGRLDLFVGVNNSGSTAELGIYGPGTGANISPNTTSLINPAMTTYAETTANYSWTLVNATIDPVTLTFDVDNGGVTDRFLTWVMPFAGLVNAFTTLGILGINENSVVTYVAATATQANSLNQDINGVNGGVNSTTTWTALGGLSQPLTLQGTATPEPTAAMLLALGLGVIGLRWHARKGR